MRVLDCDLDLTSGPYGSEYPPGARTRGLSVLGCLYGIVEVDGMWYDISCFFVTIMGLDPCDDARNLVGEEDVGVD